VSASAHRDKGRAADECSPPAAVGCHVQVEMVSQNGACERLAFDIVPEDKADFSAGFLSTGTPMAKAILGRRAGSVIPYRVGDLREVRILGVAPAMRDPDDESADREAILQKAISQSELAEAARFSLTVDLKWGGTDPQGIEDTWD
jgi:hypothetical protein